MGQLASKPSNTKPRKTLSKESQQTFLKLPRSLQDKIHSFNFRYEGLLPAEKALVKVSAMELFMVDADLNSPDPRRRARELYDLQEFHSHPKVVKSLIKQAQERIHPPLVAAWIRQPVQARKDALKKHNMTYVQRITQNAPSSTRRQSQHSL